VTKQNLPPSVADEIDLAIVTKQNLPP
jgi:hypothetical protein